MLPWYLLLPVKAVPLSNDLVSCQFRGMTVDVWEQLVRRVLERQYSISQYNWMKLQLSSV